MASPLRFRSPTLIVTAICVLVLAGSSFGKTTLTLSATSAPPTGKFLVSGAGFPAHSVVDIYFDTTSYRAARADGNGSFSGVPLQAPASAIPGKHWISAVARSGNTSAQISFTVQSDWTEFHKQNMRRWNGVENVLGVTNVKNLKLKWSFSPGQAVQSSPAIANGVIYFGANDGVLYARDAKTGSQLWSFSTGSNTLTASPAVVNDVVYVGDDNGVVYAVDASTGVMLWSYPTGNPIIEAGSPAVVNGVLYTANQLGTLYALNASDGTLRWMFPTTSEDDFCAPALANGIVYFAGGDSNFYALDANTGAVLWSTPIGTSIGTSPPAIANGIVYVGSDDKNLYAYKASSGTLLWKYQTGGSLIQSGPALANGIVYTGASNGKVYALNATTGTKMWIFSTGEFISDVPAVANGVVYIGSFNGNLYALNANTGAKLWSSNRGAISSPSIVNGMVYVGTNSDLSAFGLKSAPSELSTPPNINTLHPDFGKYPPSSLSSAERTKEN